MINKNDLLTIIKKQSFDFKLFEHDPLYSVEDSQKLRGKIGGAHFKNLFLKNKKNNFFLFSIFETTNVNLKLLGKKLNLGNLSFANAEHLKKILGLLPGAVCPYGMLIDNKKTLFFLVSKALSENLLNFHPLDNNFTITMKTHDFLNFMKNNNVAINVFDFKEYQTIEQIK